MTLALLRQEVADALTEAGINAFDYIPERISPPVAIVSAGDPYIEQGQTYCDFTVRLAITLVAGTATNKTVTAALDSLIETAVNVTGDWLIESVGQPFTFAANNAEYLAVRVTITQTTEIEGGH